MVMDFNITIEIIRDPGLSQGKASVKYSASFC